jgi:hypothetical protein
MYAEGWFKRELRCSRDFFNIIVHRIETRWEVVNPRIDGARAVFGVRERVAVTLYHLAHTGTYAESGHAFGMSKTRTMLYVDQVLKVLLLCYEKETIFLPRNVAEWNEISEGFQRKNGIPNIVGAIDGSLVRIQRFRNHDGWYCRKGFPAFNVQVVVDHLMRIRSFTILPGSQNDKSVFNKSGLASRIHNIPQGCFFVADAGYNLSNEVMTPYKIEVDMPQDEANYNYYHSKARIVL